MPRPQREPGKKPDYDLKAYHKQTEKSAYVGAAWKNDDGSIRITLDLCVQLPANPDIVLTLFPVRDWPDRRQQQDKGDGEDADESPDPAKRRNRPRRPAREYGPPGNPHSGMDPGLMGGKGDIPF